MGARHEPVLRLENVTKTYDGATPFTALDNVSMEIAKGELFAILGPSGSGKSTMLHILGCLDVPTSGELFVSGKPVSKMSQNELADLRRDAFGFIFQAFNLAPTMTALENVALPMMIKGIPAKERDAIARKNLASVGLSAKEENLPSQMSGGEKQRVAIARALSNNPKIIFADEPTGNLDSKSSAEVMRLLESLCRERGITVILITHEHKLAEDADRLIRIKDGRIASDRRKAAEAE
jgi:putative ABC transport system ATP-binding protein